MKTQMIIPGCSTPLSEAFDDFLEARHSCVRWKERLDEAERKLLLEMEKQRLTEVSLGKDRYFIKEEPVRIIGPSKKIMLKR